MQYSGYMSPEYAKEGTFSEKSNVFNFGVLILELLVVEEILASTTSGVPPTSSRHSQLLYIAAAVVNTPGFARSRGKESPVPKERVEEVVVVGCVEGGEKGLYSEGIGPPKLDRPVNHPKPVHRPKAFFDLVHFKSHVLFCQTIG
ncbi:hypothetical protein RHSIM_Rhsim07G0136000 [Rhododendron simsii]|uniref:Uncharacterized protein n=1 Tax=Rhododendron simsii TaxID=118357 RepID=A0A834GL13_RHOSS|nr:hypothetical protein RHSIM_Rhsim07G0136000 [Rhododendron simsii]